MVTLKTFIHAAALALLATALPATANAEPWCHMGTAHDVTPDVTLTGTQLQSLHGDYPTDPSHDAAKASYLAGVYCDLNYTVHPVGSKPGFPSGDTGHSKYRVIFGPPGYHIAKNKISSDIGGGNQYYTLSEGLTFRCKRCGIAQITERPADIISDPARTGGVVYEEALPAGIAVKPLRGDGRVVRPFKGGVRAKITDPDHDDDEDEVRKKSER